MSDRMTTGELMDIAIGEVAEQLSQALIDEGYDLHWILTTVKDAEVNLVMHVDPIKDYGLVEIELSAAGRTRGHVVRINSLSLEETASGEWENPTLPFGGGRD